jgi:hypothetical protein
MAPAEVREALHYLKLARKKVSAFLERTQDGLPDADIYEGGLPGALLDDVDDALWSGQRLLRQLSRQRE